MAKIKHTHPKKDSPTQMLLSWSANSQSCPCQSFPGWKLASNSDPDLLCSVRVSDTRTDQANWIIPFISNLALQILWTVIIFCKPKRCIRSSLQFTLYNWGQKTSDNNDLLLLDWVSLSALRCAARSDSFAISTPWLFVSCLAPSDTDTR